MNNRSGVSNANTKTENRTALCRTESGRGQTVKQESLFGEADEHVLGETDEEIERHFLKLYF